jgi:hypothetical protein
MNKPSNRDYTSVSAYLTHTTPLFQGEDDFIDRREDLVTLRPGRECAWLDAFVERVLKSLRCGPVTRMFSSAVSFPVSLPFPPTRLYTRF